MKYLRQKGAAFSFLLLITSLCGNAQLKVVTLQEALTKAETNYPLFKQKDLQRNIGEEKEELLSASLYPQINIVGNMTYQSEVTSLDVPGFPKGMGQKPGNYNAGLEMRFPFTQFGVVKTQKQLEAAKTSLEIVQIDVSLQQLRERVTNLFGNYLLQKGNLEVLQLRKTELDSQVRKVAIGVANGAMLKTNELELESEALSTSQNIDEIKGTMNGLLRQLIILTGMPLDVQTRFVLEDRTVPSQNVNRPELKAFEAQRNILDLRSAVLQKEARPSVYAFGQGYYGRPGYNFLNNNSRLYGTAGIGLSFNLNSLFTLSKQQKTLELSKESVNSEEATFLQNLQAALADKEAEIEKLQSLVSRDNQIAQNRKEILRVAASQLSNGAITSTDYLHQLNAATTAKLNLTLHQTQLAVTNAQHNILLGY